LQRLDSIFADYILGTNEFNFTKLSSPSSESIRPFSTASRAGACMISRSAEADSADSATDTGAVGARYAVTAAAGTGIGSATARRALPPADDDVAVTGYRIHRSSSAGTAPSAATLLTTVSGATTSWSNTGVAAGTWYYTVVAVDAGVDVLLRHGNVTPEAAVPL